MTKEDVKTLKQLLKLNGYELHGVKMSEANFRAFPLKSKGNFVKLSANALIQGSLILNDNTYQITVKKSPLKKGNE